MSPRIALPGCSRKDGAGLAFAPQDDQLVGIEIGGTATNGEPLNQSQSVNYLASIGEGVMDPENKQAALAWIDFLRSPTAQEILDARGFIPATEEELNDPHVYEGSERYRRVRPY